MEPQLLTLLAQKIRRLRHHQGLTLAQISSRTGFSKSLLSKIENARTVPSLPVFLTLISALGIPLSKFFEDIELVYGSGYVHRKPHQYQILEKEAAVGFNYKYVLGYDFPGMTMETQLLTLDPGAKREQVTTDGFEFKFILKGNIKYKIGSNLLELSSGDAFFFDGRIAHAPINDGKETAEILVVYFLT